MERRYIFVFIGNKKHMMSTDEFDKGEEKYEALRTLLKTPCRNLLRNILILKFRNFENLLANISHDSLSDASRAVLESIDEIKKLTFPTLCDIFRSGVCDNFYGSPAIGWSSNEEIPERCTDVSDDILRIWRIWNENIRNNELESISDGVSINVLSILMDIAERLSNHPDHPELKDIGTEFQREIVSAKDRNFGSRADAIQAGDGNRIEFNIGSSFTGTVTVLQEGNNNKIIYQVEDDCNFLDITANGCVTAVLRSDNPRFQELSEIVCDLNIEEVNELPVLKESDVSIQEIKPGSLIVSFTIKDKKSLENNIQKIFQCIFGGKEIGQILEIHGINEIKIAGYVYNSKEYCLEFGRENPVFRSMEACNKNTAAKLHFHTHLTWTFAECICDADIFLTDLFYHLSDDDFTTEANDIISITAKGSIINPKNITFSHIANMLTENVDVKTRNNTFQLAGSGCCEIQSIQKTDCSIRITLRTKTCLKYANFIAEDGIVFVLMRCLLESTNPISEVKLMRIGILIDTNIVQNRQKSSSMVVGFRSKSKITKTLNNVPFPLIITSLLKKCENADVQLPKRLKINVKIIVEKSPRREIMDIKQMGMVAEEKYIWKFPSTAVSFHGNFRTGGRDNVQYLLPLRSSPGNKNMDGKQKDDISSDFDGHTQQGKERILYQRTDKATRKSKDKQAWTPVQSNDNRTKKNNMDEKHTSSDFGADRKWLEGKTPEEKLSTLFEELKLILESQEYDNSLRKSLSESNPGYLTLLEKRKKDLLKEDHGIVVAGETSAGKSTLINKLLQKRIFKERVKESTSTICKIRNSDEIRIVIERKDGECETITLPRGCNPETQAGLKILRKRLKNLTDMKSSKESINFRYVDIGFPISLLKGNTIIVDTPGIGDLDEFVKKVMEYLPNAVSFIFVVNVANAGGMQKDRLPEILKKILHLQIEDEMPCFDPRKVIFITNKWDTIITNDSDADSSDEDEENKTWEEVKKDIKTCWPSVEEKNIFKMSLLQVSPSKTNDSTKEFDRFKQCLMRIIKENENIRLLQHLRFLDHFLKSVLKGIDSGLALGKRSEKEQNDLAEKHKETIKQLKIKCVEEGSRLREAVKKIIEDSAQEVYDYMSTDLGKERILNPPGHKKIMDEPYIPNMLGLEIKMRVELYIKKELDSERMKDKFILLKDRAIAFYNEVSSEISEMENDWKEDLDEAHGENAEERSIAPFVAGVIATSPLWLPAVAVGLALGYAFLGISIVAAPIAVPVVLYLSRDSRRQKIIDEEYEMCKSSIRSTVCNQLGIYEEVFEKLIKKITKEILPRRISSLEKLIQELCENRHRILANQETLESLLRKVKSIEERKLEIQMNIESLE